MEPENLKLLHEINNRVSIMEERSLILVEIKSDLRILREKLEKQSIKQAASAATIAIIVSVLFSVLKVNYESHTGSASKSHAISPQTISIERARN